MKLWMKKIAVALVAIVTLGLYIPPLQIDTEAEGSKESVSSNSNLNGEEVSVAAIVEEAEIHSTRDYGANDQDNDDDYIAMLTEKAKAQTMTKMGPKITEQVEDDFMGTILPAMEEVLQTVFTEAGEEALPFYGITEQPAKGTGERIFHVYDFHNQKDVARFDVRRDNRPQEGYWFNFHYHLSTDNFEEHHEIGEIYWNKNAPPKWMT